MKKILAAIALMGAVLACEPAARTIESGHGPVSSAIATTHSKILIAAEDHGQLFILDRATNKLDARVDVGDAPAHVITLADGTAAVSNRFSNNIAIVDVAKAKVLQTIDVGVEPFGMVEVDPGKIAVVLAGESSLAVVDVKSGKVTQKIALADKDPRAVALLQDGSLYVSHMATGAFSRVHLDTGTAVRVDITTPNQFGPRLTAEHLRSLTVDENTGTVLTAHTQANTDTVRAPIDDPGAPDQGQNCGYSGCTTEEPAVTGGVTEIDPQGENEGEVIVPQSNQNNGGQFVNGGEDDCFDCGNAQGGGFGVFTPNPPSVLNPHESRFAGTQIQNPAALALFDGNRGMLVVNLGSKNAVLLRRDLKGVAQDVIATVKLGNGAQSVAVSDDGAKAYVWNQFDLSMSVIDLPKIDDVDTQSKFVPDASGKPVASQELGVVPELAAKTVALPVEDKLTPTASIGRKLFHDATDSRIAQNGAVSCGTCHPDGRNDGRTWQFVFGPRNTPQLGGSILDTAPFHWPGDVPTVADLNTMTVLPFMGGTGLDAGSFQYIAEYIGTLRAAPSIVSARPDKGLTAQEARGEALFYSDATQCSTCHAGAHFTDNVSHDVASKALNAASDISLFQTPVLHGLNRSAPYFHDGRFGSLEDLVNGAVRQDTMGHGSQLTDQDATDLVAYLKTL